MSKKLLLADDSITIRKVVGIIFANEDYSLSLVDNGNEAVDKAREILPDIMLADVVMPGKNGYEVCEEIRRDSALDTTPLLLLTGAFEPFDEDKAKACGADDFISKPFESQQLLEKVRALIELGESRKAAKAAPREEPAVIEPVPVPEPAHVAIAEAVPAEAASAGFAAELIPPSLEPEPESPFLFEELSTTEEAVEALPEDDLWGAFELDAAADEQPIQLDVVDGTTASDPFCDFSTIAEDASVQEAPELPVASVLAPFEPAADEASEPWQMPAEDVFTLGGEDNAAPQTAVDDDRFAVSFDQTAQPGDMAAEELFVLGSEVEEPLAPMGMADEPAVMFNDEGENALEFASEEEYVPLAPPEPPPLPAVEVPQPATAAPPSAEITLSEEQLAAVIGKVSRDIIEKIAWEVVPDLAEMLIREEIRKLKKGVQD